MRCEMAEKLVQKFPRWAINSGTISYSKTFTILAERNIWLVQWFIRCLYGAGYRIVPRHEYLSYVNSKK